MLLPVMYYKYNLYVLDTSDYLCYEDAWLLVKDSEVITSAGHYDWDKKAAAAFNLPDEEIEYFEICDLERHAKEKGFDIYLKLTIKDLL